MRVASFGGGRGGGILTKGTGALSRFGRIGTWVQNSGNQFL